jgi:tetratricopeptide (TPR) repeat protein
VAGILLIAIFVVLNFSSPNYYLGNIFFGNVSKLYNVEFAQFFYTKSAYPLFGRATQYSHYQLARTYFIQGDLFSTLEEAGTELDLYPGSISAHYLLGLTYGYLNLERMGIDHFTTFLTLKPSSWAAKNDKAWLQFRIGDIDGALATLEPANDYNPWTQNTYGTMLLNKGRLVEAKKAFLAAEYAANNTSQTQWGKAYPGNDPRIYPLGLEAMKKIISENIALVNKKLAKK